MLQEDIGIKILAIIASAFCGGFSMLFSVAASDIFLMTTSVMIIAGTIALIMSEMEL